MKYRLAQSFIVNGPFTKTFDFEGNHPQYAVIEDIPDKLLMAQLAADVIGCPVSDLVKGLIGVRRQEIMDGDRMLSKDRIIVASDKLQLIWDAEKYFK